MKSEYFWLALALLANMLQGVYFAHHVEPTLDEGAYAYKGFLYLTGKYQPFQAYGPWTNKMPLSFLVPGVVQVLLGSGLRSGRYFALFLFFFMLLGIWKTALRFSGKWVAVGMVAFIAVTPFFIELYSQGVSQVLIACMLAWTLALTLGNGRSLWQLAMGSTLAGLVIVTRENMAPLVPLLGIYLVWENGLRRVWPALLAGVASFGLVHALYWPEIMRNWMVWLPGSWLPFLDTWRILLPGAENISDLHPPFYQRLFAFWHAVYLQMPLWIGVFSSWLLWPAREDESFRQRKKALLFLSFLFAILLILHAVASVSGDYCIFCFENYIGFFAPVGWLLVALLFPFWQKRLSGLRQAVAAAVILVLSAGWGFGSAPATAAFFLNLQVPRLREMHILPGRMDLWRLLANKFGWSYDFMKYFLPALAGLALAVLVLLISAGVAYWMKGRNKTISPTALGGIIFLIAALLVSPFNRLDHVTRNPACPEDIIAAYERTGDYLAHILPAGSWVYWEGVPIVEMLYLPQVNFYPPQINQRFSFFAGGDPDVLERYGLWGPQLAEQWLGTADYVLVEESAHSGALADALVSPYFVELAASPPVSPCREASRIRIFRREKSAHE